MKCMSVGKVVLSVEQGEGMGARVRRSIGRPELRNFDPFLMLDEFKVGAPAGFPDHPHRGFETVTYMLPWSKGSFMHEDSTGHGGDINAGDLQWMTAGRGIMHAEMPKGPEEAHGLQMWVDLKQADRMCPAGYQEHPADKLTHVEKDGVHAVVIAGEALGVRSPVRTRTPTEFVHFTMAPGSRLENSVPAGFNAFCYVLKGKATFSDGDGGSREVEAHNTVTFLQGSGEGFTAATSSESGVDFMYVAGKPHGEPIVQHGPFCATTRQEIMQAMMDFQSGQNGFENANRWSSKIGGRF